MRGEDVGNGWPGCGGDARGVLRCGCAGAGVGRCAERGGVAGGSEGTGAMLVLGTESGEGRLCYSLLVQMCAVCFCGVSIQGLDLGGSNFHPPTSIPA